ncbi:MAG: hypothetical protein A2293_09335 [Elusimicrobia bacterium RIFOXYB2_FULL_49_7]|nr:MAG: hypothetical protein A2293_09335 [Elusimicrobia bacterium RIFOXYB2_FULL_49_7]
MAYPYGGYTANVKRNAVKFYEYARATTETSYCLPPIKRFEIESHLDETLGNLQIYRTAIDSAAVQNVLVTFYAHDFQANVSSITATLIDYAQSKGVEILTMSEALERYGNAVERAYANTGDMTAISQDGIAMLQAREINCVHPLTTYSDRLFLGWDATNAYFKIQTYGRNLQINPEGNTVTFTNPVMIGSIQHSYVRKTSTYTAANDLYIFCDATSTAFTVTLPAPSTIRTYTIKKVDSSANKITVVPTSGTIDGAANFLLDAQYESATFTADWDVWRVTGHYSGTP